MKKLFLEDVIEKYYLGGLVERVKIQVTDKTLTTKFIEGENFATLDWNPGGQELLAYVRTIPKNIEIEMLTSSGGLKYHTEVTIQKTQWLCERGIEFKINTVPGRKLKAAYATPTTILVDDTPDVIDSFGAAGGITILHKDVNETIAKLQFWTWNSSGHIRSSSYCA